MKRRTAQSKKRRDRKSGESPYQKYGKVPYKYEPKDMDRAQERIRAENRKYHDLYQVAQARDPFPRGARQIKI
jgi:hypothetical protein